MITWSYAYKQHMIAQPHSLLTRFYALCTLRFLDESISTTTAPHFVSLYFVVMENFFPSNRDIHEIYDLKVCGAKICTSQYQTISTIVAGLYGRTRSICS